jgi:hypothetical protein
LFGKKIVFQTNSEEKLADISFLWGEEMFKKSTPAKNGSFLKVPFCLQEQGRIFQLISSSIQMQSTAKISFRSQDIRVYI